MTGPARPPVPEPVLAGGVIAIGRHLPPGRLAAVAEALRAAGVRAFELTLDSGGALAAIADLARTNDPDELLVGAGTVLDRGSAEAALAAGARFLVMPHTDPALVSWAAARGVPAFPGALSPTEVLAAWRAGAAAVKLFPAATLGPGYVRELRGPLADIPLVPTGGITADNAGAFVTAGAVAVGCGGWLMGDGEPGGVRDRAAAVVAAVRVARR